MLKRIDMRIKAAAIFLLLAFAAVGPANAQADREIFDRAKVAIFDKEWHRALKDLNQLIADYPHGKYTGAAHFYKGRCLEELQRPKQALESYHTFIKRSENESLKEEATISIVNLDLKLYRQGEKHYIEEVFAYLKSRNLNVRYYTAIQLSHVADKKAAARAVPVLKTIIANESDRELVDRARIALMRIDPGYLKEVARAKSIERTTLHIKVYDKKSKSSSFSLNIPFGLARLALDAIPAPEKELLKKKGYDLDGIIESLVESGEIIKIESEDSVIRIWID